MTTTKQQAMLTTVDNPFNPFTSFDDWFGFDVANGYNTSSYLARVVKLSDSLSEADEQASIEEAIDEIVELNVLGIYRKAYRDDPYPYPTTP